MNDIPKGAMRLTVIVVQNDDGGVGVSVRTDDFDPALIPDEVGQTWAGLCSAINAYMNAKGCEGFNCLQPVRYQ